MKPYSVTRRLIATVLILELIAALALTWLAAAYEGHTRFHSFDLTLSAHADTLFGAVGDSDDPEDNVMLDLNSVDIPAGALFDVQTANGRVLGRSPQWPAQAMEMQLPASEKDGIHHVLLNGKGYRFVVLHAVRVVDPGEKGGGIKRPVVGAVWRFYRACVERGVGGRSLLRIGIAGPAHGYGPRAELVSSPKPCSAGGSCR